jgi:hypothetical protein
VPSPDAYSFCRTRYPIWSLSAAAKIHIPRRKKAAQRPRESVLHLKDGSTTLDAKSLDDLAAQLRQRYPDGEYERTLHRERDRQAEQRRAHAMNNLIEILVAFGGSVKIKVAAGVPGM